MVSVAQRTAFNEHLFGEPEQDANTALTELDKGIIPPAFFFLGTGVSPSFNSVFH